VQFDRLPNSVIQCKRVHGCSKRCWVANLHVGLDLQWTSLKKTKAGLLMTQMPLLFFIKRVQTLFIIVGSRSLSLNFR